MRSQKRTASVTNEPAESSDPASPLRHVQLPLAGREIWPLQRGEFAISTNGLAPHFIGDANDCRKQLQGLLHAGPKETDLQQMECTLGEETFTLKKRRNGNATVWSLPLADKSRLAKAMGWSEKIELEQLQDNEIAVSNSGLRPHYYGNVSKIKNQLQRLLHADPQHTALHQVVCTIGEDTFTFHRRQTGRRIVWAFSLSDRPRLAEAMDWSEKIELEQLQDNEFAISGPGLEPHFIGDANDCRKQLLGLLHAGPKETDLQQMECTLGEETFTLKKRRDGNTTVWSLPRDDRSRLARAMGWSERLELGQLQDNEIAISEYGLSPHFIGDACEFSRQMGRLLRTDPKKTALHQIECTIGAEAFTLHRRKTGTNVVWALSRDDRSRLARAMGWTERIELGQLQDNEISISRRGLSTHFIGKPGNHMKELQERLIADPEKTALGQVECTISEETFTFFRRQSGKHLVWALPCVEKSRLARAMGWAERVELGQLQANEIAVSGPGLAPHFIGCARELKKELQGLLHADPQRTASLQIECVIDEEMFTFLKRQNRSIILWAFPIADKPRLAKAMNWEIREEKEPSTGVAALATFLSAVEKNDTAQKNPPRSSTSS